MMIGQLVRVYKLLCCKPCKGSSIYYITNLLAILALPPLLTKRDVTRHPTLAPPVTRGFATAKEMWVTKMTDNGGCERVNFFFQ